MAAAGVMGAAAAAALPSTLGPTECPSPPEGHRARRGGQQHPGALPPLRRGCPRRRPREPDAAAAAASWGRCSEPPTCAPALSSARWPGTGGCSCCAAGSFATPTTPTGPQSGCGNAGREPLSPMSRQPSFASQGPPLLQQSNCCGGAAADAIAAVVSLSLSIGHWSQSKIKIGTKPHILNRVLCKAADLNQRHVQEKGVCSDSNQTA